MRLETEKTIREPLSARDRPAPLTATTIHVLDYDVLLLLCY